MEIVSQCQPYTNCPEEKNRTLDCNVTTGKLQRITQYRKSFQHAVPTN
jgi:hypothetical protein